MTDTPNLALPLIAAGQAQKHVTHNEALVAIDALLHCAVRDKDLPAPPPATEGDRYIVAAGATGAWAGQAGRIAVRQDGAWSFYVPRPGFIVFVVDEALLYFYGGAGWTSLAAALNAIQNLGLLGIGTQADAGNPFSAKLNKALWTARMLGEGGTGDLRYTLNKEAPANVLSLLMQSAFSGRAEIGLTGDDDLHVKVSGDGASWLEALRIERATGRLATLGQVGFPAVQNASADANTLDDYAEGAFTPTFSAVTTAPTGVGYALQSGRYTKVGRLVLAEGQLTLTSKGTGGVGVAMIGGLPFVAQQLGFGTQLRHLGATLPAGTILGARINGATLRFQSLGNTGAADVLWGTIGDTFNVLFTAAYSTA